MPTGHKPFIDDTHFSNKTEDKNNDSTDNSCNENKDAGNKINVDRDEYKVDEYKEYDSEAPKSDEILINKTESE